MESAEFLSSISPKLKSKAKPQEIHIWEFPKDKIGVLMDKDTTLDLFSRGQAFFSSVTTLAKYFGVSRRIIPKWRDHRWFIPLRVVLELVKIVNMRQLGIKNETTVHKSWEEIEQHIIVYKAKGPGGYIYNPNLPIVECPALFRILVHLMCDGSGGTYQRRRGYYNNTCLELHEQFKADIREVFGKVNLRTYRKQGSKKNKLPLYETYICTTILYILHNVYRVEFGTHTARLPKRLFELPREFADAAIQTWVDDEGSVSDNNLRMIQRNCKLVMDFFRLLRIKFPELANYTVYRELNKGYFRIDILAEGIELYRDLIGCIHPQKKRDIDTYIRRKRLRHRRPGLPIEIIRGQILNHLRKCPQTVPELAETLLYSHRYLYSHIDEFVAEGKVKVIGRGGRRGARIFGLGNS